MNSHSLAILVTLSLVQGDGVASQTEAVSAVVEREYNLWPFVVGHRAAATDDLHAWTGVGPLLFKQPAADTVSDTTSGFRPFWIQLHNAQGELRSASFLYPLFSYSQDDTTFQWSFFELIRRKNRRRGAPAPASSFDQRAEFEIFPFWFARDSDDPERSYRAFFPFHGTLRNRLGFERLSWTLFPFYVENERRGAVTTSTPWPFLRVTRGAAHGWAFWPLFNTIERPGISSETYYLWPLIYTLSRQPTPDDPPETPPRREAGVLPFYARSTGPGYMSESYLWPLFGYTKRTQPVDYRETRYLWPLWVQGRGEDRRVNRWAPLYTHSTVKGYDKHWFAWPLFRHAQWTEEGVERTRSQLLYFVYWREEQRSAGRVNSPSAELLHLWPLFSSWDNGAGRQQWQLFSPFEVFLPGNARIRQAWSPLLALARHDQRAPGDTRTSLLWNAVTWEQRVEENRQEFHLGPLLGVTRAAGGEKRVAFGNGLFGFHRTAERGWRLFWLDFPRRSRQSELK